MKDDYAIISENEKQTNFQTKQTSNLF